MLLAAATRPKTTGPPLNPRSRKALAVPAALPRWDAVTRLKTAANTAGVRKAAPTASTVAPRKRLQAADADAVISSPRAEAPSDAAANRIGGARSGTVANTIRQVTTTIPNSPSVALHRSRPNSAARSDAKARNPATAAIPANRPSPGTNTARWISGAAGAGPAAGAWGSGTRVASTVASTRRNPIPLPDQGEPPEAEQRLPDDRAGRDSEKEGQGVVAQCLAGPARRSKIGQRGESGDEVQRFGHPHQQPQHHQPDQVGDEEMAQYQHGEQCGPADEQGPA